MNNIGRVYTLFASEEERKYLRVGRSWMVDKAVFEVMGIVKNPHPIDSEEEYIILCRLLSGTVDGIPVSESKIEIPQYLPEVRIDVN